MMDDTESQMMNVLPLVKADLDACAKIVSTTELFRAYGYTGETARKQLETALSEGQDELWVAKDQGRAVGFAWFIKKGAFARSGYLRLIAVDSSHLKAGIGRTLMTELEKKYLSPNGMFLLVTSTNNAARGFYEKLGYRRVGEIPGYVKAGIDEVIYYRGVTG